MSNEFRTSVEGQGNLFRIYICVRIPPHMNSCVFPTEVSAIRSSLTWQPLPLGVKITYPAKNVKKMSNFSTVRQSATQHLLFYGRQTLC